MIFSNVRFVDIGASNSGSGSLPSSPLRNLPSYDNFVDDCLYILRKYPQVARTSNIISPTDMTESEIVADLMVRYQKMMLQDAVT